MVQVEIERGDAFSSFKKRHNDVHGKCGFATAALLVAYDDDVRRRVPSAGWHDRCTHYITRPFTAEKKRSPKKLKGAKRYSKPVGPPAEQRVKFELAVNLRTAEAIGLTIPQTLR